MAIQDVPKPDFMEQEAWDALISTRDPKIIKMAAKAHVQSYRDSEGEGPTYWTQGGPTLLLTTVGRKSGNEHTSPCNFMPDGEKVYVVGSIAGLDHHPAWALNLDANPEATVQVKGDVWPAIARKLEGEERAAIFPKLTDFFPLWGHFQKYCDREFMVFEVTRKDDA